MIILVNVKYKVIY